MSAVPDWTTADGAPGYLSIDEFVAIVGEQEAVAMTDVTGAGVVDRDYLVPALRAAQAIADTNLAARYAVPIAVVPDVIKTAIADIARGRLYPRGAPEGVADLVKAANALLVRIASGALPLPLPTGQAATPAASEAPILFAPGRRAYPDDLDGY